METHDIDSILKKLINESDDYYNPEADKSKERIWKHIQLKQYNQPKPILFRILATACILLFISTSVVTISNIKAKKTIKTLAELNNTLKNQYDSNEKEYQPVTSITKPDTVYVEKKVLVSKPVVTTKLLVDTVFIREKVYVENKHNLETLAVNDTKYPSDTISQSAASNYEKEILIRHNEPANREKEKRIQIKFGGNKDQSNRGTLAFTTEL